MNDVIYSGKVIKYKKKHYTIRPEQSLRGCMGCCFYNVLDCPRTLTDICRQGYIFEKSTFN